MFIRNEPSRHTAIFAVGFFVILFCRDTCQAAPFQNGSFELPVLTTIAAGLDNPNPNGIVTMPGWVSTTTSNADIQNGVITSAWDHVYDGNQAVLMNGDGIATTTLSQTFDTAIGTALLIQFELSAQTLNINGTCPDPRKCPGRMI